MEDLRAIKRTRNLEAGKRNLILTAHKGLAFKPCQGISRENLCCNYRVMDLVSGCPMDCSYCILQSYLANNPTTTIYVNVEDVLNEVARFLAAHPKKFFRIGTGELSDSLALDYLTEFSSVLIPFFASKQNAMLELKTKTVAIDHLLNLEHKGRTVIAWSVNTPGIIASEERGTASLDERLAAATKAAAAGFGVAFHFDPIILTHNANLDSYLDVVDKIFETVTARQISWISLGLLRYPPDLSEIARKRFPETKIFTGELVPAGNKMRYLRFIREAAYKPLWDKLISKIPPHKLYLCMETETVWEKIDPAVKSNACIEKRLCNTETIQLLG